VEGGALVLVLAEEAERGTGDGLELLAIDEAWREAWRRAQYGLARRAGRAALGAARAMTGGAMLVLCRM
jgi:hypothetical protein